MRPTRFASAPAPSQEALDRICGRIPVEDGYLLCERYLKSYTHSELADELGITVARLDQRTTRAKRQLREALDTRPDLVEELCAPYAHV